jgi:hypothetical protein
MRSVNSAIKVMLGGMVLVLATGPALAAGEHKGEIEKAKVEINKVEKNKIEKAMIEEKKAEELLAMKAKANSDAGVLRINRLGIRRVLLDEDILGEGILEGLVGEAD